MADTVEVRGLRELQARLKELPRRIAQRVLVGALMAGAEIVRKEAKANAERAGLVETGALVKNVAKKRHRGVQGLTAQVQVGVRHGKPKKGAKNQDDPFYWRFAEFGTRHQRATPFLRPAFESRKQAALDAIVQRLGPRIEKEAAKLVAEGAK